MELALEAGADDITTSGDTFEVLTSQSAYEAVLKAIIKLGSIPKDEVCGFRRRSINILGKWVSPRYPVHQS